MARKKIIKHAIFRLEGLDSDITKIKDPTIEHCVKELQLIFLKLLKEGA